ncbi:mitochondrial carrier isoform 1 [Galdieria sulphuraria]|uniref:Mitochondrial carrier isoform 1 n=1 Tax=Galdieria sulphuraria TaxID=130081 RepID=M2WQU6_GALSU|nr:mitochondrial carrier isoform 1 [Galdieria sulphuraria]EME26170.1 mitochondrial carrier isoform 1 [Galdieria sulphuraria]|eukprot:XP_005702690.1 mitochondrial carrier isoform 1 [Galdieria sulphuraria]
MNSSSIYKQSNTEPSSHVLDKKPNQLEETSNRYNWLKSFVAGGFAGCVAKTSVAPLERTKILMQVSRAYGLNTFPNVYRGLVHIYTTEGFLGLYKGNAALLARIFPYAAIQFASFEFYNRTLSLLSWNRENPLTTRLLAGSLAGATAVVCTYPLDLVRARFACQIFESKYDSLRHAIKTIFLSEGGLRGFYSGIYPTLAGVVPYAGINFFTYGLLRRLAERKGWTERNPTIVSLLCGACAGLVGQTFTFPLDVIRRRMQTIAMFRYNIEAEHAVAYLPKRGFGRIIPALIHIIRHEGFFGMYKGLSVNYLKAAPAIAISFTTYDTLRHWWNIPTGKYSATASAS